MKFLRFLLGFLCGIWSMITCAVGFIIGIAVAYDPRQRPSGQIRYDDYRKK